MYRYAEVKAEEGLPLAEDHSSRTENKYRQIMSIPSVHFMATWSLIYVGTEVTLGGKFRLQVNYKLTVHTCMFTRMDRHLLTRETRRKLVSRVRVVWFLRR